MSILYYIFSRFGLFYWRNIASPEKYARSIGVTIGKHCFISTREWGHEPYLIEIGDNVRITRNVSVHTYGGALGTCSASRF